MSTSGTGERGAGPPLEAWRPWAPQKIAARLATASASWHVAGGCALDVWLDATIRPHADIEIAIPRGEFAALRDHLVAGFPGFGPAASRGYLQLFAASGGEVRRLAATAVPAAAEHQVWVLDAIANVWRMDILLEPGDALTWVFRRDERIRAARERMVGARRGTPFLRPEGVLLYKAKACREKDERDLEACLPRLDPEAKAWLRDALEIAHPKHAWIARLPGEPGEHPPRA